MIFNVLNDIIFVNYINEFSFLIVDDFTIIVLILKLIQYIIFGLF